MVKVRHLEYFDSALLDLLLRSPSLCDVETSFACCTSVAATMCFQSWGSFPCLDITLETLDMATVLRMITGFG